jgi:hypothetical protein
MGKSLTKKSMIMIMAFMMLLSSVAIFAGNSSAQVTPVEAGNYSMSYDPATSTVYNITYTNPNYTILAASQVVTSGTNSTVPTQEYCNVNKILTLSNVSIYTTDDNDMLLLSTTLTQGGQPPEINVSLPSAATPVIASSFIGLYNTQNTNTLMLSFLGNTIYRINVTDGAILFMANSPSTLSPDGKTISFLNTSLVSGSSLIVGITPTGTIKFSTAKQAQDTSLTKDPLTYDPSTGAVTGKYLSLTFDNSTGTIHNYKNIYSDTVVFSSISTKGHGNFGNGYTSPLFPSTDPIVAGNALFFANQTSIFKIYNNIATMGGFFTNNGTLSMVVASGLNISTIHFSHNMPGMGYAYGHTYGNYTGLITGNQFNIMAAPTIISISNSNFKGQLFIHDGSVSVVGNTIAISTTGIAYVQFVAQNHYLNYSLQLQSQLQYAMQHGKLGAFVYIGSGTASPYNYTYYYNSSLNLALQHAYQNRVEIQLSAQTQQGQNIAVFIPNSVISNGSQFTLKLDNQVMTQLQDANGLINTTSQSQAQYYLSAVNGGTLIIIHTPHFSTHTLEINGTSTTTAGGFPYLWVAIGAVIVIAVAVLVMVLIRVSGKK